jgi:hypothetical protein
MRRRLLSSILCTALFATGPAFAVKRASPDASEPRQQRASLLEQAGLGRLVPTE